MTDDAETAPLTAAQEDFVKSHLKILQDCFTNEYFIYYEWEFERVSRDLRDVLKQDQRLWESGTEKYILSRIKRQLDEDVTYSRNFKDATPWPVLNQVLTLARLKEVSRVKIIRRGGRGAGLRYDITELMHTFFGRKILHGISMQRRRVATKDELETIRAACLRIKLDLPEIIEPTTTEEFFATSETQTEPEA